MNAMRIAVVGAGIAGLTAAIAFARRGADVTILEQADELTAVGAGLQLSPNACRILEGLGLLPAIEQRWNEVARVVLRSGRSLRQIAEVPAGDFARRRWHAPYGVIHRSDLQGVLVEAANALPGCRLLTGQRLEAKSPEERPRGSSRGRLGAAPALIVGADGVWSCPARRRAGKRQGVLLGLCRVAHDGGPARLRRPSGRRSRDYRLPRAARSSGRLSDARRRPPERGRRDARVESRADRVRRPAGSGGRLSAALDGWHPSIRSAIAAVPEPTPWPLYEVGEGNWTVGEDIVLIGDAAHAMMPFAAQGAAMAIEDAFDLAESFARSGAGLARCIRRSAASVGSPGWPAAAPSTGSPTMPAGRSVSAGTWSWRCGSRKTSPRTSTGSTDTGRPAS